jgi:hypothetical protein
MNYISTACKRTFLELSTPASVIPFRSFGLDTYPHFIRVCNYKTQIDTTFITFLSISPFITILYHQAFYIINLNLLNNERNQPKFQNALDTVIRFVNCNQQ